MTEFLTGNIIVYSTPERANVELLESLNIQPKVAGLLVFIFSVNFAIFKVKNRNVHNRFALLTIRLNLIYSKFWF